MEKIDSYTVYRQHQIVTGSDNTLLFTAENEPERRSCLCQIVALDQSFNDVETRRRMQFLQSLNFGGYLQIEHFKIMNKALYVFFRVEGQTESLASLLGRHYMLSNFEIARLGMLMLDSYALFVQANVSHQDIE